MHLYPSFGNYNSWTIVLIFKIPYVLISKSGHCYLVYEPLSCLSQNISELVCEDTDHHNPSCHLGEMQALNPVGNSGLPWFCVSHPNTEASKRAGCLLKIRAGKTPLCLGSSYRERRNPTYLTEELWSIMFAKCFLIPCWKVLCECEL